MAQTKKKTAKKESTAKAVVTQQDKDALIKDLKETTQQLGRLPRLMLAPIVWFVAQKYDAIPNNRRKQLQKIVKDIKENGASAADSLKWWFQSLMRHDKVAAEKTTKTNLTKKSVKTPAKKKVTKKTTTIKKTDGEKTISTTPKSKKVTTKKTITPKKK